MAINVAINFLFQRKKTLSNCLFSGIIDSIVDIRIWRMHRLHWSPLFCNLIQVNYHSKNKLKRECVTGVVGRGDG